ncbi:uncharacterized protein LOC128222147 [Mya arenaria]|uniref:uncharacterized protein LOC128222147 n=1 Tax=Mya arenaria TaxID=6604 RepID=UPI0022E37F68|nr:uncharacterized protein LOC128222147 [Mya arenaria]
MSSQPSACLDCQAEFGPKFKCINCNFCENSFCLKCSKLKSSLFNDIGKESSVLWHCSHCRIAMPTATRIMAKLSDMEIRMENLEKETNGCDKEMIRQVLNEMKFEEKEIEEKKLNIVIHQLKESEKKEEDLDTVLDILNGTLNLGIEVENVVRLGKMSEDRDKPRPVRFTVGDFDVKRKVLSRASGLKNNEKYSRVFITPDLTQVQRKEAFHLRQEKRRREKEGERNLAIRKGRIVKLPGRDHSYSASQGGRIFPPSQSGRGGGGGQ